MAFRRPLYWDSGLGGLREMGDGILSEIQYQTYQLYLANPTAILNIVGLGNLPSIYDTRLQAGAYSSSSSSFPGEGGTAEPSVVSVTYERVFQDLAAPSAPADTNNVRFPVYYDGSNVRAMTLTDMIDTFAIPAINTFIYGSSGSVYTVSSSSSVAGYNLVSSTPIFSDTRANTGAYTYDGIPETLDQPFTVTDFYLHRKPSSTITTTVPLFARSDGHLKEQTQGEFDAILQDTIWYATRNTTGYRVAYNLSTNSGAGIVNGSGMTDTRLDGSGAYTEWYVNGDDYRAQEFPNGSPYTVNTYYLLTYLY